MMILVDSDIFIDHLRNYKPATAFLESLVAEETAFSAITEAEILSGKECDTPSVVETILHLLANFSKIPVGNRIAQTAGEFRRRYGVPLDDCLIAATTFHHGMALATCNEKDYGKIKEIKVKVPYE